jgi:SAM-dependent methyltransferase
LGIDAFVPEAALRRVRIYRLSRTLRRYQSRTLNELPAAIEKASEMGDIRRLGREVRPAYRKDPVSAAKYAEAPRFWLFVNTLRAAELGLHEAQRRRILDIGCGPGFFMAVARSLGHDCEGVDAPESHLSAVERRVYGGLTQALKCREGVKPLFVERFVRLPFDDGSYDLITAFWVCFNRHRQADEWGVEEWRFFAEDALRCLRQGGRVALDLVENRERYGDLRFYDEATLAYFRAQGTVVGNRVILARPCASAHRRT